MTLAEYQSCIDRISFGKRLPTASYVFRDGQTSFGKELDVLVAKLVSTFAIDASFNLVKFRLDEIKVSFLAYPDFFDDPHPALNRALTIDLATGKVRPTDYSAHSNPP